MTTIMFRLCTAALLYSLMICDTTAQVVDAPASAPVVDVPASAPVVDVPASAPVVPASAPVVDVPASAPAINVLAPAPIVPPSAPVVDVPASAPVVGVPASAPVVGIPASEPVVGVPASEPVVNDPLAAVMGGGAAMPTSGTVGAILRLEEVPDDPAFIYNECLRANCKPPSLCYIPHPTNCFKFIMCQPLETGSLLSQVMPCAFGTKWKSAVEPSCGRYDLVDCINDPCKNPKLSVYAHPDNNRRTFWRCVQGQSHPACCDKYQAYDPITGTCVNDVTSDGVCPLMNDATCSGGGLRYAHFLDGNCRTHWDCKTGHQHPVCCQEGQGFNVSTGVCEPDNTCNDPCPQEYQDSCSKPGVMSYDLVDGNCRTYMKCNKQGQADPMCCLPSMSYDNSLRTCVDAGFGTCFRENCPYGFMEECRLEALPNEPGFYKNLDAFGGTRMPCPVGTVYNATLCQCRQDENAALLRARPLGCGMAIHVLPPSLKNMGDVLAALLKIGDYGQGETGVGNMSAFWDGGDGINIPYYGSQTLWKFFLQILFQPTQASSLRQILLSSCHYINGQPSLEVSLENVVNGAGTLTVKVNAASTSSFQASAPYKINDDLVLRLIYDGSKIGMFLDYNDPTRPQFNNVQVFSGQVPIDRAGLRFAHCRYENGVSSFIGNMKDIQLAKCVPDDSAALLDNTIP